MEGGETRNETIMNSIRYIEEGYGLDDDTLLVTHDSVRPFLTHRIIEENIEYGQKYDAVDTVIPATDTIVASEMERLSVMYRTDLRCIRDRTPADVSCQEIKRPVLFAK